MKINTLNLYTPKLNHNTVYEKQVTNNSISHDVFTKSNDVSFKNAAKLLMDLMFFTTYLDAITDAKISDDDLIFSIHNKMKPKEKRIYRMQTSGENETLMYHFAAAGRLELAKAVLADPDVDKHKQYLLKTRTLMGESPLDVAIANDDADFVELILNHSTPKTVQSLLCTEFHTKKEGQPNSLYKKLKIKFNANPPATTSLIEKLIWEKAEYINNLFSAETIKSVFNENAYSEEHCDRILKLKDCEGDNILQACIRRKDFNSAHEIVCCLRKPENTVHKLRILKEKNNGKTARTMAKEVNPQFYNWLVKELYT